MMIKFVAKKMELTAGLKSYAEEKLSKLEKFFGDDAEVKLTMSASKGRHTAEATVFYQGIIYRAEETTSDMYVSIDKLLSDFERQIRKNKTRLEKRLRSGATLDMTVLPEKDEAEELEFNIVKKKAFTTKPMSDEEAILQMNLLGHNFFVYKNAETEINSIVYKRKDGNYGVIEVK